MLEQTGTPAGSTIVGQGRRLLRIGAAALSLLVVTPCVVAPASTAQAQSAKKLAKPTKEQQAAAGKRFREGERAFAKHDYSAAAAAFEEAYAIAPHPDVLLNAIDAREKAGDLRVAARHCQRLVRDFPDERAASDARGHLAGLTPKLARLEIVAKGGEASDVTVDDEPVEPASLAEVFVDPGDHVVRATLGGEKVERRISVIAGARGNVLLEPAPETPPPAPAATSPVPPTADDEKPLHPAFFFVGLGLTAAAGGVLVWSGLDTSQAREDFDANPTQTGLDDGRAKQLRTNVLVGVTAGLGVATAAIGLFATEWGGSDASDAPASARLVVGPTWLGVEGSFR